MGSGRVPDPRSTDIVMGEYCVPQRDKVALLTLSAQEDYGRPGSPLKGCGAETARREIRRLVDGFRQRQAPVFHAVRLYRADGSNVDACRRSAIEEGLRVLMPGSFGAELIEEIRPEPGLRLDPDRLLSGRLQELGPHEWAFYRSRWGAFYETPLAERLRALGVNTLVLCGLSSAAGTRATIYEASARDLRAVVVPDALAGPAQTRVDELARIGVYLMTSKSCLDWLGGPHEPCAAA